MSEPEKVPSEEESCADGAPQEVTDFVRPLAVESGSLIRPFSTGHIRPPLPD